MHRVLDRIGRLALSVWNNLGICNTAVRAPLAQFVGSDTAARFNASRKTPLPTNYGSLWKLAFRM